jgi:hypothetical protein
MIRLDLSGSTIASFTVGGGFHVVDVSRGGVVCTAARKMLALGIPLSQQRRRMMANKKRKGFFALDVDQFERAAKIGLNPAYSDQWVSGALQTENSIPTTCGTTVFLILGRADG